MKVRVAILEDHQSVVDGYLYRLRQSPEIEVVGVALFGAELEDLLAQHLVNVLLLDLGVRTAVDNPTPYPVLDVIPHLLETYDNLSILVVSMYTEPFLIRGAIMAGVRGYILKEDQTAIQSLANVIQLIADGGVYFSGLAHSQYLKEEDHGPRLSSRQMEVLSLCAAEPDLTSSAIARRFKTSRSTIRNLLTTSYARLGVHSRAAAILKARRLGLIGPIDDHNSREIERAT